MNFAEHHNLSSQSKQGGTKAGPWKEENRREGKCEKEHTLPRQLFPLG
jgi:hypothetical protein